MPTRRRCARRWASRHPRPSTPGSRASPLGSTPTTGELLDRGDDVAHRHPADAHRVAALLDAAPALPQPDEAPLEQAILVAAGHVRVPYRAERAVLPEQARPG